MENRSILKAMTPSSASCLWYSVIIIAAACVLYSGVFWITAHPYSFGWDEAYYVNHAVRDYHAFKSHNIRTFGNSLFFGARDRPFANRLLALPFSLVFGPDIPALRMSSFVCFFAAAFFIYLTGKRLLNFQAGLIASLIFLLSPEILASSVRLYAEASLYLAIASLLYFLLRFLHEPRPSTYTWLGLGISIGFGLLSKLSFALMAAPLCVLFIIKPWNGKSREMMFFFLKVGLVATAIAGLWWFKNYSYAMHHMKAAGNYTPASLGPLGPSLVFKYCFVLIKNVVGYFSAIVFCFAIGTAFFCRRNRPKNTLSAQKQMLWGCLFCGLPLLIVQFFTVNHCMRLASPAIVPFSILVSFFIINSRWKYHTGVNILLSFLFILQAIGIVSSLRYKNEPVRDFWEISVTKALPLREQWDWDAIYDVIDSYEITQPSIGLLGTAAPMKPSNVRFPWVVRSKRVFIELIDVPDNIEDNINELIPYIEKYDIIVTIADYPYKNVRNLTEENAINAVFIEKIKQGSDFNTPVYVKVGRYHETTLAICIKKKPK